MLKSSDALALFTLPVGQKCPRAVQTALTLVSFAGAVMISGCGAGRTLPAVGATGSAAAVRGNVHGGQQPVSGAQLQLWAAGAAGDGSAATPLLTTAVYSDGGGGFDITGDYACPSATTQVYLTATGGNPGLSGSVNNGALALVAALGDCGSLATVPTISINELTTVAAAYGLAPFAAGVGNVGTSATNLAGLRSAMQTAMLLASSYSGSAPAPTLPAGATTETAKLVTLGNVLASCVNSDGGAQCSALESDASVAGFGQPGDTFQVALMVAQHPGNNVAAVFNDAPAQSAFGGGLVSQPHDWTMTVAYKGGGLGRPNGVAVDGTGNLWVSNYYGGVSGFSPQGAALFAGGVTPGMGLSSSATVDANGYVWVANGAYDLAHANGSVTQVSQGGMVVSGGGYTQGGIDLPDFIAAAPNGTMVVANSGDSVITVLSGTGAVLSGAGGYGAGVLSTPSAIAVDAASNVWIANKGNGQLVEMDASGNVLQQSSCCGTPDSVAIDRNGYLWVGDSSAGTVTEVRSDGVVLGVLGGNFPASPKAMSIDGGSHIFIADALNGLVFEVYDSSYAAAGTPVGQMPAYGLDAGLQSPGGIAADASGNVWVTSSADNRLVEFVGLAVPVSTPKLGLPGQP